MILLKAKSYQLKAVNGQGTLAFVLLAGGVILLIGLTLAFLVISFANTSSGFQAANRALAAATAGAEDALLRLTRDNSPMSDYSVSVENGVSALVGVSRTGDEVAISSSATVLGNSRKIEVLVSTPLATGKISVLSWKQVAF